MMSVVMPSVTILHVVIQCFIMLSVRILSVRMLSLIMPSGITLRIVVLCQNAEYHNTAGILNVIILSVSMLGVIMLSVVASQNFLTNSSKSFYSGQQIF
jgi:hypothetical protein